MQQTEQQNEQTVRDAENEKNISEEIKQSASAPKTRKQKKKRRYYNPFYFVGEALRSAWRNRVMSIASVLVLASCLVLLGAFGLLIRNINVNLEQLGMLNEIVVFVDYDADQERVDGICAKIKALDNVTFVEYVSKEIGLDTLIKDYPEYASILEDIKEGGDNPLSDSFIVTYGDNSGVLKLESDLHSIPGVRKVNNRLDYATKIEGFKNGVSLVFVWLFVLLFAVSIFVIFNTIKLAVHGRRAEISIMRFIGSTKFFIVAPFVIEGVLIGFVSSIIAYIADAELYKYVLRNMGEELKMIQFVPFKDVNTILLLGFLAIGVLTGITASLFSIHKNLKS
ncbi:MAG: ABC transporter permease [Clostridia bacterium]|nr:ABC transporter permease [Clostridia bacterium]